jgi:RNA polymerase sigma-70 factor (ECF subfamily)
MAIQSTKASRVAGDDEAILVAQAKAGNVGAFEELVNRYERNIYRLAQRITQNHEDAEDVLQDSFLKAYTHLGDFQGDSRFYTWLVRIAVNESLMRLRKRKPGRTVSLDEYVETEDDFMPREVVDWGDSPENTYAQKELEAILAKAIDSLEPGYRTVFLLRDVEQFSTEETAQMMQLSVPAVKSRLLRARLRLREQLGQIFKRG